MAIVVQALVLVLVAGAAAGLGAWLWFTAPPDGLSRSQNGELHAEMRQMLYDYESARFEFLAGHRPATDSHHVFCFRVNAKNRLGAYTGFQEYRAEFFSGSSVPITIFEGHNSSCQQRVAALRLISPLNDMIYREGFEARRGACNVSPETFESTRIGMTLVEVRAIFQCRGAIADVPANEVFETATISFGDFKPSIATFRFDRDGKAVMRFYAP